AGCRRQRIDRRKYAGVLFIAPVVDQRFCKRRIALVRLLRAQPHVAFWILLHQPVGEGLHPDAVQVLLAAGRHAGYPVQHRYDVVLRFIQIRLVQLRQWRRNQHFVRSAPSALRICSVGTLRLNFTSNCVPPVKSIAMSGPLWIAKATMPTTKRTMVTVRKYHFFPRKSMSVSRKNSIPSPLLDPQICPGAGQVLPPTVDPE